MNHYHTPERRARASLVARTYVPSPDPTPEEIAERCAEIQAGWSWRERRYRGPTAERWTPDEVRCVDFSEG
jgi:hypothetical protein